MFKNMALTKKYKPGQLVTINNRVYRVCKETCNNLACRQCNLCKCINDFTDPIKCINIIGFHCYFKLIKV